MGSVRLRRVTEDDLPLLYQHQRDPLAVAMAAFPSRDWDAFLAHWTRIMADPENVLRTILADGRVAGSAVSFEREGLREVGYWLDREFWGRGIATAALDALLRELDQRPLYARVAQRNRASVRVLEKCGFRIVDAGLGSPDGSGDKVEEFLLRLDAGGGEARA